MLEIWNKLTLSQNQVEIVILLLENPHDILFLQTGSKLFQKGIVKRKDFIYVTLKSIRPFVQTE